MPSVVNINDIDEIELDDLDPTLKSIGYHLKPDEMRPSVWFYEENESNNEHRHETQEELYAVLDGRVRLSVGDEDFELEPGDFALVSRDEWRQLTALEASTILAIGAPNEAHDAVFPDEQE